MDCMEDGSCMDPEKATDIVKEYKGASEDTDVFGARVNGAQPDAGKAGWRIPTCLRSDCTTLQTKSLLSHA